MKSIVAKGIDANRYRFGIAAEAGIYPGMLVKGVDSLTKVGADTDLDEIAVVREAEYKGLGLNDVYPNGEEVNYVTCNPGDIVYLRVAAGEAAITDDAYLAPDAGGYVKKAADKSTAGVFAKAQEAVDNSGGSSDTFVRALIITPTQTAA